MAEIPYFFSLLFSYHPHESQFLAREEELLPLPPEIDPEEAIFLPLTEAAVNGKTDRLLGLKENVLIGRLIPARCLAPEEEEDQIEPEIPALTPAI